MATPGIKEFRNLLSIMILNLQLTKTINYSFYSTCPYFEITSPFSTDETLVFGRQMYKNSGLV
jgi:hypothetical protein